MKRIFSILFIGFLLQSFSQDSDWKLELENVPNNRTSNNSRISDLANVLEDSTIFQIDSMLIALEDSMGYQVAVVCLDSVGNQDARMFYTDLFNFWGIGDSTEDNGLLISLTMDLRQVDFITGRGTENVLTDGYCYDIQQENMIPFFKEGDFNMGMLSGVQRAVDKLYVGKIQQQIVHDYYDDKYGNDEQEYEPYEFKSDAPTFFLNYKNWLTQFTENPEVSVFIILTQIGGALVGIVFLFTFLIALLKKDLTPNQRYKKVIIWDLWIWFLLFPLPFLPFFIMLKIQKARWKKRQQLLIDAPRTSETGMIMRQLTFEEQDIVLSKGLVDKEFVKSKLYIIFGTDDFEEAEVVDNDVAWGFYANEKTKDHGKEYSNMQCERCKYKTVRFDRVIYNDVLKHEENVFKCSNCHFESKQKKIKLTYTSSPSSSSGSGSSYFQDQLEKKERKRKSSSRSSSGSSSSSSSRSRGSSWGGGSSRGGGSSSKW